MPIIDMKNTTIYLEDGYSEAGAIDNVAGYPANTTTIDVDGISGIIPVGARISIGSYQDYTVTATTETTGNTTDITITPGLQEAVIDNDPFTVYGRFLEIRVGEGTLSFSETVNREFKMNRGRLYQVRNGDEVPMDVSMQFLYEELKASTGDPPTPVEVLKKQGPAVNWLSTFTEDPCALFSVNIRFVHAPPQCSGFEHEQVILPFFYYEKLDYDLKAGTISVSGKCNATEPTVTRIT